MPSIEGLIDLFGHANRGARVAKGTGIGDTLDRALRGEIPWREVFLTEKSVLALYRSKISPHPQEVWSTIGLPQEERTYPDLSDAQMRVLTERETLLSTATLDSMPHGQDLIKIAKWLNSTRDEGFDTRALLSGTSVWHMGRRRDERHALEHLQTLVPNLTYAHAQNRWVEASHRFDNAHKRISPRSAAAGGARAAVQVGLGYLLRGSLQGEILGLIGGHVIGKRVFARFGDRIIAPDGSGMVRRPQVLDLTGVTRGVLQDLKVLANKLPPDVAAALKNLDAAALSDPANIKNLLTLLSAQAASDYNTLNVPRAAYELMTIEKAHALQKTGKGEEPEAAAEALNALGDLGGADPVEIEVEAEIEAADTE